MDVLSQPKVVSKFAVGDRVLYYPSDQKQQPAACTIVRVGHERFTIRIDGVKRLRSVTAFSLH
jgi:hypothetical protein